MLNRGPPGNSGQDKKFVSLPIGRSWVESLCWRQVVEGQEFAVKTGRKLGQKWLVEGESPNGVSFVSR